MEMLNLNDYQIADFIEEKILETRSEEQHEWVRKYDVFTSKKLFEKYNQTERLKEVDKIRKEVLNSKL